MADNKDLVIAFFDTEAAADEAAAGLKSWDKASEDIALGNVGVLVKGSDGSVNETKMGPRSVKKGAGVGLVLGVVAAPFTGGLSLLGGAVGGTAGGGAVGMLFKKGLPEADVKEIGSELDAGHAAVAALVAPGESTMVKAKLAELGGMPKAHQLSGDDLEKAATEFSKAPPSQN